MQWQRFNINVVHKRPTLNEMSRILLTEFSGLNTMQWLFTTSYNYLKLNLSLVTKLLNKCKMRLVHEIEFSTQPNNQVILDCLFDVSYRIGTEEKNKATFSSFHFSYYFVCSYVKYALK